MTFEKTTSSGAMLKLSIAPFQDSMNLKNSIMREIAGSGLDIDIDIDFKNLQKDQKIDVGALVKLIALVDSSPSVNQALMKCLERCTYNGDKITAKIFETESAREDYYEIVLECLKVNLIPFFKGLSAKLNAMELPWMRTVQENTPESK